MAAIRSVTESIAKPKQQKKTSDTHEFILEATVSLLARKGIDHITVSEITKVSGVSRPTFYTYFGDLEGVFAEVWLKYGQAWLERLVDPYSPKTTDNLLTTDLEKALVDILITSRRKIELNEVVSPSVARWWKKLNKNSPSLELIHAWVIATKLGTVVTRSVNSRIDEALALLPMMQMMPANITELSMMADLKSKPSPLPLSSPGTVGKDVEEVLSSAAMEVVASAGVAYASLARIARKARLSTGSVYPRFRSNDELLWSTFDWSVKLVVSGNATILDKNLSGADQFGEMILGSLMPSRDTWRNYRLEMLLEARVNEEMALMMTSGLAETNNLVVDTLKTFEFPQKAQGPISALTQALAAGFSMLQNSGIELSHLDHRVITRYMTWALTES